MSDRNTGDRELGYRIQNLRKQKNWSQEELADNAGVGYSTLVKIENGINFGRRETHQKIAKALEVSASYLIYGQENEPDQEQPKIFYYLSADPNLSPAAKKRIEAQLRLEYQQLEEEKQRIKTKHGSTKNSK